MPKRTVPPSLQIHWLHFAENSILEVRQDIRNHWPFIWITRQFRRVVRLNDSCRNTKFLESPGLHIPKTLFPVTSTNFFSWKLGSKESIRLTDRSVWAAVGNSACNSGQWIRAGFYSLDRSGSRSERREWWLYYIRKDISILVFTARFSLFLG
jgi:hypothetical protein